VVAGAGVVYGSLAAAPLYARAALRAQWNNRLEPALTADLQQLGGHGLTGSVQCVDSISGCITVLDRLRLVQSTGTLYDEFLFGPHLPPPVRRLREQFGQAIAQRPPAVLVVTAGLFPGGPPGYAKIDRWPWFSRFLAANYVLYADREFGPGSTGVSGYRLYLHHKIGPGLGSDLPPTQPDGATAHCCIVSPDR
jgi:hypothetical protein